MTSVKKVSIIYFEENERNILKRRRKKATLELKRIESSPCGYKEIPAVKDDLFGWDRKVRIPRNNLKELSDQKEDHQIRRSRNYNTGESFTNG